MDNVIKCCLGKNKDLPKGENHLNIKAPATKCSTLLLYLQGFHYHL